MAALCLVRRPQPSSATYLLTRLTPNWTRYRAGEPGTVMFTNYYSTGWGAKLFRILDLEKKRRIREVLSRSSSCVTVLDLGSGLSTLFPAHIKRIAVDYDADLLRQSGGRAVLADLNSQLPFRDRSVDVVLMADSIEHMKAVDITVSEIARILGEDGVLIIFTPPYDSVFWVLAEKMHRWLTRRWAGHTSPMTREALYLLLDRHFEQFNISWFNFGLSMGAVAGISRGTQQHAKLVEPDDKKNEAQNEIRSDR